MLRKTPPQEEIITWTVKDLWELPDDGNRYEVIDGELYMIPPPSTNHQMIINDLAFALDIYIRDRNLGRLFLAPCAVILKKAKRGVQPDIFFVSRKKFRFVKKNAFEGAPDLIVEVSSPSTYRYDRTLKKSIYAEHGVPEYWIIDTKKDLVLVFSEPAGGDYKRSQVYHKDQKLISKLFPGWSLEIGEIFRGIE